MGSAPAVRKRWMQVEAWDAVSGTAMSGTVVRSATVFGAAAFGTAVPSAALVRWAG